MLFFGLRSNDVDEYIKLYSLAENKGGDAAQIILEDAHMNGDEIKKERRRKKAADQGNEKVVKNYRDCKRNRDFYNLSINLIKTIIV